MTLHLHSRHLATGSQRHQHSKFRHFTEMCFRRDCYLTPLSCNLNDNCLWYEINKEPVNLCYLRSRSVVDVVVVPLWLHDARFPWKGFFHSRQHWQVCLDRRSWTENKNTLSVEILCTHIMCTECTSHKHSKIHTQNPYQVPLFYRNAFTAKRLQSLLQVILMTVPYGRNWIQNMWFLLPKSVVEMAVGHASGTSLPNPMSWRKGA
jgi:hypothetical protein